MDLGKIIPLLVNLNRLHVDHYYSCLSQEERARHMQVLAKYMASPAPTFSAPMFLSAPASPAAPDTPWHAASTVVKHASPPPPPQSIKGQQQQQPNLPAPIAPKPKKINMGPFQDDQNCVYFKVCKVEKCTCKVYPKNNQEDEDGTPIPPTRPDVNPKGLYVYGFDADEEDFEKSRADIKRILGRKASPKHTNIRPGNKFGFVEFDTHAKAALAQELLVAENYTVNFQRIEDLKEDNARS